MYRDKRDLDTIATEIGGIGETLAIISAALDPNTEFDAKPMPGVYAMSLFALAEYYSRLQEELDDAHMRLEVKPLNQTA